MSGSHNFHKSVLREYDVRGVIGETLNTDDAHALGRAFGTMVRRQGGTTVAVGYDGRLSSPELSEAAISGLMSCGISVKRIGLGPTPMLYFAVKHLKMDAGMMITGSHNPPNYNGFKMTFYKGPVFGDRIQELGRIAASGDFTEGNGAVETVDLRETYVDRLMQDFDGGRPLTIAWDAGNGSTGEILQMLADRLPGKQVLLYEEIDGNFPNHHPDPTVKANLADLCQAVADDKCDIGIGFDGDGDRIGAVDENGNIIWGDQLLAVYAAEVLESHPGATIIADVKASKTLFDDVERLGGKPLMWKTGHSLIKDKMAETGSPLAGEMSGHIFFADKYYGYDDALYCAVRLAGIVSRSGKKLSDLVAHLPTVYNTPETRFQVDEERKFSSIEEIATRVKANANGAHVDDLDGVRVTTDKGWWLLRASNTQDVLVARAEAFSEEDLADLKQEIIRQLELSGIEAPSDF